MSEEIQKPHQVCELITQQFQEFREHHETACEEYIIEKRTKMNSILHHIVAPVNAHISFEFNKRGIKICFRLINKVTTSVLKSWVVNIRDSGRQWVQEFIRRRSAFKEALDASEKTIIHSKNTLYPPFKRNFSQLQHIFTSWHRECRNLTELFRDYIRTLQER